MEFVRAAALLMLVSPSAIAHAILIDSVPPPQGHVSAGRLSIVLKYNSRIDSGRSKLTLAWPDQHIARLPTIQGQMPDVLAAMAELAPGDYVLKWQVLAIDGHLTRGRVPFTVDPAGPAAAAPAR